ncbi:unnamed protein product [Closterium sp. NIES-65]|nr:unnamed protein product [Closterium sp. NIES-65]
MGAAQGGCHTSTDGTTAETVLPGGSEQAGAATGEHVTPRDAADADGGVGENDEAEIVSAAATGKPVVADADGPVVGTAADPAPAGGSAAAVDGGSASPAATPRAAQAEAEEMRPGAAPEQSAEVALSASPAPVTAAALAAAVSAAIGEHGDAPAEEGATTAAACAGTPVAVVAVSRQEHGQAEGEAPGPASGASSGAARSRAIAIRASASVVIVEPAGGARGGRSWKLPARNHPGCSCTQRDTNDDSARCGAQHNERRREQHPPRDTTNGNNLGTAPGRPDTVVTSGTWCDGRGDESANRRGADSAGVRCTGSARRTWGKGTGGGV